MIRRGDSRIECRGQFSLGFPRRDGGEEINARIRLDGRPVADLLDAFDLEDYPVTGTLSGDFHLYGPYTRPFGFGRMTIDDGTAYGERFDTASAGLRFEGNGVRLDGAQITQGAAASSPGRLCRLERHLLVQRRGPRAGGRDRSTFATFPICRR